jgi:hypothetical protein
MSIHWHVRLRPCVFATKLINTQMNCYFQCSLIFSMTLNATPPPHCHPILLLIKEGFATGRPSAQPQCNFFLNPPAYAYLVLDTRPTLCSIGERFSAVISNRNAQESPRAGRAPDGIHQAELYAQAASRIHVSNPAAAEFLNARSPVHAILFTRLESCRIPEPKSSSVCSREFYVPPRTRPSRPQPERVSEVLQHSQRLAPFRLLQ